MNGKIYVCVLSYDEAVELGAEDAYRESNRKNAECAKTIGEAISENYDGYSLNADCAKRVLDQYGFDRVDFVLSCNIRQLSYDGRISKDNKDWAQENTVPLSDGFKTSWLIHSHPGLLDIFTDLVRKHQEQDLFPKEACFDLDDGSLEERLLVLDIEKLRESCWSISEKRQRRVFSAQRFPWGAETGIYTVVGARCPDRSGLCFGQRAGNRHGYEVLIV